MARVSLLSRIRLTDCDHLVLLTPDVDRSIHAGYRALGVRVVDVPFIEIPAQLRRVSKVLGGKGIMGQ
eukprot:6911018-Prymnesium_polylepis.1